jgi:hypothetical protein
VRLVRVDERGGEDDGGQRLVAGLQVQGQRAQLVPERLAIHHQALALKHALLARQR